MDLIDKIKAIAKEGVDFGAIEEEIKSLNPLANVTNKTEAWNFIKSNELLLSAFDSEQNKRSEKTLENFKAGKMQEEIKAREEALRRELNPEESPADKKLREMEGKIKQMEAEKEVLSLKEKLSNKAKELNFDTIKAKDYSVYGEEGLAKLEQDAKWMASEIETRLSAQVKEKFQGIKQPVTSKIEPADLDTKIREARKNGQFDLALRMQLQKKDQTE